MEVLGFVLLGFFAFLGILGLFFNFLGTFWILLGAFLYACTAGFRPLGPGDFVFLVLIYAAGEIMDWVAIGIAVKKTGASRSAIWGSVAGAFAGAVIGVFFAGIGAVLGLLTGAFLGAFLCQWFTHGNVRTALKAGAGSSLGYMISWVFKIFLALVMTVWIAVRIFWFYGQVQV